MFCIDLSETASTWMPVADATNKGWEGGNKFIQRHEPRDLHANNMLNVTNACSQTCAPKCVRPRFFSVCARLLKYV